MIYQWLCHTDHPWIIILDNLDDDKVYSERPLSISNSFNPESDRTTMSDLIPHTYNGIEKPGFK